MSLETAVILSCHGEDDFSVWNVELPTPLLRRARHAENTATGGLAFILEQIAVPEPTLGAGARCHFLCEEGRSFALFTLEVDADFFERHRNEGCSVRGGKEDILTELEEQFLSRAHIWAPVM